MRVEREIQLSNPIRRAFTLVELIVVIGIIAVLMALLMPAFRVARDSAHTMLCASNLKQMGIAMNAYKLDHEFYPGHCGWSQAGNPVAIWPVRLRPYLASNRTMFYCPSRDEVFQWHLVIGPPGGIYATQQDTGWGYQLGELMLNVYTFPSTYGYNDWGTLGWTVASDNRQKGLGGDIGQSRGPTTPIIEITATAVTNPSEMVAIADNTPDGSWDYNVDPTTPTEYPGNIHNQGGNFLFADGHVQWYLQSSMINTSSQWWNTIDPMWNNDHKSW
jgi:prepilin-type processing-associated H-X9-DG protein/prepilin-type N-terminal cleavage/methylation domain-containing protein